MHDMHWYGWHTVTERLQGRAYALTRGRPYRVILDPGTPTGVCDFTDKKILINPNLFDDVFRKMGLTGVRLDRANFLVSRAVTGHESLHVVYSDPAIAAESARSPALKTVFNLLEDARIEKIGSETSHVAKTLFRFVNRTAAKLLPKPVDTSSADGASGLDLLLRWRLGASIPRLGLQAQDTWEKVRALAQQALCASECREVLELSEKIVGILGLGADSDQALPREVAEAMERTHSEMAGQSKSPPMPSPLQGRDDDAQPDEDGSDEDDNASEPDLEPEAGTDGNGQDEEPADEDGTATDSNNEGSDEDLDDDREAGADTQPADDDNSNVDDTHDSNSPDSDGGQDDDNGDARPDGGDAGDTDFDAQEPSAHDADDFEKLVDETALQADEDLNSLVPDPSAHSSLVARAKPHRGRCYSDVVASPYVQYLSDACPIAAELVRELRAEGPRGASGPSPSAGRFRARYYVRDSSRPFAVDRFRGVTVPSIPISLVIDRSASMEHIVDELRTMSIAIAMACEDLCIPLSIWALEGQVHIKRFDEHGPQVLAKIAGIEADTLTRVMPTITDAAAELRSRPEEIRQMVFIHDGMPSDRESFVEWRSTLRGIGVFGMFIMPEDQYRAFREAPGDLREHMDALFGPRNHAIAPVTDIARHWCSFVRNTRSLRSTFVS